MSRSLPLVSQQECVFAKQAKSAASLLQNAVSCFIAHDKFGIWIGFHVWETLALLNLIPAK